jgi:SpoIIAA-like
MDKLTGSNDGASEAHSPDHYRLFCDPQNALENVALSATPVDRSNSRITLLPDRLAGGGANFPAPWNSKGAAMIQIMPESEGKVIGLKTSGKLTDQDYKEVLIPRLEALINQYGKIRLLCLIGEDFAGMEAGAMWDDAKFFMAHTRDFEKMVLVGGSTWMEVMMKLFSPLVTGGIKVFSPDALAEAWVWIKAP